MRRTDKLKIERWPAFILAMLLVLFLSAAVFPGSAEKVEASSGLSGNSYKASVTIKGPVPGSGGTRLRLAISFTELGNTSTFGSALVMLPDLHGSAGFSDVRLSSAESTATGGKKWEAMITERQGRNYLSLRARKAADYLRRNETVTVSFTANAPAVGKTGAYLFQTRAWTDRSLSDSLRSDLQTGEPENLNHFAAGYSDPFILVERPTPSGHNLHTHQSDRIPGLRFELQGEGNGFQTTIFSTTDAAAFLTTVRFPAAHSYSTTSHQPAADGAWTSRKTAENQPVDLLQGYAARWQSYYHRTANPGPKEIYRSLSALLSAQDEFSGQNLANRSESELRVLAHSEGIAYYRTELTPLTEQVWFAGVALEPGAKGVLIKRIDSSYGRTDQVFTAEGELWPTARGYRGPADGFGFVKDGDGYKVERGIDYPGSHIDLEQVADVSAGQVYRYIDLSSPYSNSVLKEEMSVSGSGKVDESLINVNIRPGAFLDWPGSVSFNDDWDLWFSPNQTKQSVLSAAPIVGAPDVQSGSYQPGANDGAALPADSANGQKGQDDPNDLSIEGRQADPPAGDHSSALVDEVLSSAVVNKSALLATDSVMTRDFRQTGLIILSVIAFLILVTLTLIVIMVRKNRA